MSPAAPVFAVTAECLLRTRTCPLHDCGTWNEVAVDIHGHLNRAMTHLIADIYERGTGLNQKIAERLPEVVETDLPQTRPRQERLKDALREIGHLDRCAASDKNTRPITETSRCLPVF